ncbi:MAG: hypothetical protein RR481_01365 [Longicatena sp.]
MKTKRTIKLLLVCMLVVLFMPSSVVLAGENGCTIATYPHLERIHNEKPNTIDLLVLGDSFVYRSFSPLVYWKEKQITSYALGAPAQPAWLSYYQLLDALEYQKPKVVVLEINELFSKPIGLKVRMSKVINSLQSENVRLQAIHDASSNFNSADKRMLLENHPKQIHQETMNKIAPEDSERVEPIGFKGYFLNVNVSPLAPIERNYMSRANAELPMNENGKEYIEKIISLCKKHNIQLLFVKFPTIEWATSKAEVAKKFADDNKIPFFDLNTDMKSFTIDWNVDSYDGGNHMNDFGAQKVTKEMAEYLEEHTKLSPTTSQEVKDAFDASYKIYEEQRIIMIESNDDEDAIQ